MATLLRSGGGHDLREAKVVMITMSIDAALGRLYTFSDYIFKIPLATLCALY